MAIGNIDAEMFQSRVYENDKAVIVEFYSDDCVACNMISDDVEEAAKELKQKVTFFKFNCQNDEQFALERGVSFIPSFILFDSGKNTAQLNFASSKNDIMKFIKKHIDI